MFCIFFRFGFVVLNDLCLFCVIILREDSIGLAASFDEVYSSNTQLPLRVFS